MIQTTEIESFIDCNYKAFLLKENAIEIVSNDSTFLEKKIRFNEEFNSNFYLIKKEKKNSLHLKLQSLKIPPKKKN